MKESGLKPNIVIYNHLLLGALLNYEPLEPILA